MKKFLFFAVAAVLLFCGCKDKKGDVVDFTVEDLVYADFDYMCHNYGCGYVWYETELTLTDFVDAEDYDGSFASMTNVFQIFGDDSTSAKDAKVVMINHVGELMDVKEVQGCWLEDVPLDTAKIKYTYNEAYERLLEADCIKPHSKYVTLRNPLGPKQCNAQYIFGNAHGTLIFLDALTGDVSDKNPAFTE